MGHAHTSGVTDAANLAHRPSRPPHTSDASQWDAACPSLTRWQTSAPSSGCVSEPVTDNRQQAISRMGGELAEGPGARAVVS